MMLSPASLRPSACLAVMGRDPALDRESVALESQRDHLLSCRLFVDFGESTRWSEDNFEIAIPAVYVGFQSR